VWDSIGALLTRVTSHSMFPAPLRFIINKVRGYMTWMPQQQQAPPAAGQTS
jgi:hypothetical protein